MKITPAIARISDDIRNDPAPIEPWLELIRQLINTGQSAEAISVLQQRHAVGADSLSVLYDALGVMVLERQPAVRDFLASVPANHVFQPIVTILKAFAAVMDERSDEAISLLRIALNMVPQIKSFAETDGAFVQRVYPLLVNQVEQLATATEVAAYDLAERPVGIEIAGRVPVGSRLVVAVAADSRYLVHFAENYARSFLEFAGEAVALNIHAIDPDDEAEAVLARILRRTDRVTVSREYGQTFGRRNVYFACGRFFIAPELLRHTGLPVLLTDIDLAFRRPITDIVGVVGNADVALFETDHCAPQLRCDAAVVLFAPTMAAHAFLRIMRRYLAEKLRANAAWMLDQAALWSIIRAHAGADRFSYLNLTRAHGASQGSFVAKHQDDGAKHRIRNSQNVGAAENL